MLLVMAFNLLYSGGARPSWKRLFPGERSRPKLIELTRRLNC